MSIYYVYAYLRKSNLTPYYIGKGCNGRAYSKGHNVPVPKDKSKIIFIKINLTAYEAFDLEIRMIRWYGREDLGTGILKNKTNGGEGVSGGSTLSNDHKHKISLGLIGRSYDKVSKRKMSISASLDRHNRLANGTHHFTDRNFITKHINYQFANRKHPSQIIRTCPHCNKIGKGGCMLRWHFDNCKAKM